MQITRSTPSNSSVSEIMWKDRSLLELDLDCVSSTSCWAREMCVVFLFLFWGMESKQLWDRRAVDMDAWGECSAGVQIWAHQSKSVWPSSVCHPHWTSLCGDDCSNMFTVSYSQQLWPSRFLSYFAPPPKKATNDIEADTVYDVYVLCTELMIIIGIKYLILTLLL